MSQRNEGMDLDFGAQFLIGIFSKLTIYIMVMQKLMMKQSVLNIERLSIYNTV